MLKRYCMLAFAVGLMVTPISALSQGQDGETQGAATEDHAQPQKVLRPFPVEIIESDAAAKARQLKEDEENSREIRGLAVTEATNDATQRMATYALWSTLAVILGNLLLAWTIKETRKANKFAQAAIDVTRLIGEAQVRAYLGFEVTTGNVQPGKPISFDITVRNHGQSPALKVALASNVLIQEKGWQWPTDQSAFPKGLAPSAVIYPQATVETVAKIEPSRPLSDNQVASLKAGTYCVFGGVLVRYEDVFEEMREATFYFEFSGPDCFATGKARLAWQGNYEGKCRKQAG